MLKYQSNFPNTILRWCGFALTGLAILGTPSIAYGWTIISVEGKAPNRMTYFASPMAVKPLYSNDAAAMLKAEDGFSNSAKLGKLLAETEAKQLSVIRIAEQKNSEPEWKSMDVSVLCSTKQVYIGETLTKFELHKSEKSHLGELSKIDSPWKEKIYNFACNESQWQPKTVQPMFLDCQKSLEKTPEQACFYREVELCESDLPNELGITCIQNTFRDSFWDFMHSQARKSWERLK
jgi:hypothetical protein